ncbi:DUF2782 domain-containing protein [Calidifontimicrobium sp. SYSU G02091]|uniref:DUF2782 domain-containing protein n=1 Tax=Calidifontimicrobium sp. SYSU G02091 TaxID=2926421 RepID=UPI001F531209|nr:DUF2782 domain-containing protein [Calidifontimicrobium sp. SYSU G02091]MCI1192162.1 DUF2782 domain-containing protein [Calidifontimicrobium sp. SYSU G02091]
MLRRCAALFALSCAAGAVHAATPAAAPVSPVPEPQVRTTVIEDDAVRVEELRVRGEVRQITVHTKGERGGTYHVVPADGARDMSPGPASGRGAAGQRVWTILRF